MWPLLIAVVITQDRPSPEWTPVRDAPKNLSHELTIPPPAHAGGVALTFLHDTPWH